MKIALDVLGGDNAPMANIEGAINYLQDNNNELILVGNKDVIESQLINAPNISSRISIIHTNEN